MRETYDTFLDWIRNEILPGGMDHDPETVQRWQEEFDEWLNSVKAGVWEEAYSWGLAVEGSGGEDVENPYRKESE